MKKFIEIGILVLSILVLRYGCEKIVVQAAILTQPTIPESIVDPNDPNALSKYYISSGSMNQSGNPPSPSTSPTAPVVDTNNASCNYI